MYQYTRGFPAKRHPLGAKGTERLSVHAQNSWPGMSGISRCKQAHIMPLGNN